MTGVPMSPVSPDGERWRAQLLGLLEGTAPPAHWSVPAHAVGSAGSEAADLAAQLGIVLLPTQRFLLELLLAERADHQWAAFETTAILPRQLGKTLCLQVALLHDLFVRGVHRVTWSAHVTRTCHDTFAQLEQWIAGTDWLRQRVAKVSHAAGAEGVILKNGSRVDFLARTSGSGRGLAGDVVVLDEALELVPSMMGALIPTLTSRPNAQVRYGSSAGVLKSEVLRGLRDRGRTGGDPTLGYAEWCAPTGCADPRCWHGLDAAGCALDDEHRWQLANPTVGARVSLDYLRSERRALPPREFARERMGWWDDPPAAAGQLLPDWPDRVDAAAQPTRPVFGVDLGEDRLASIGVAWRRPDGAVQVMVDVDTGGRVSAGLTGSQTAARLVELLGRWQGSRVVLGGPAVGFEDDLREAQVRLAQLVMLSSADFAKACGQVDDRVRDGGLWHGNQTPLNVAVTAARWRSAGTGGERAWQLKDAPGIAPLAAVTRALAGLGSSQPPAPLPLLGPDLRTADGGGLGGALGGMSVSDLSRMQF